MLKDDYTTVEWLQQRRLDQIWWHPLSTKQSTAIYHFLQEVI